MKIFLCYHVFVPLYVVGQANVVNARVPIGVTFVPWPLSVRANKDYRTNVIFRAVTKVCL